MAEIVRGSCLCGGVRFEVELPFRRANYCHCSRCRKHSGAAAGAQARVAREQFRLVAGEELVRAFTPEGGRVKAFCSVCGSSLFGGTWPDGPEVSVRLGVLDDDPGIRPQYRAFVASRAPWEQVPDDGLPRFDDRNQNE
ncbi:MAG: GFA family protein [Actinomycetota bacterium]|nr:GFA family protein [Actinomycetota bacterium]